MNDFSGYLERAEHGDEEAKAILAARAKLLEEFIVGSRELRERAERAEAALEQLRAAVTRALDGCVYCQGGTCSAPAHQWLRDALADDAGAAQLTEREQTQRQAWRADGLATAAAIALHELDQGGAIQKHTRELLKAAVGAYEAGKGGSSEPVPPDH